MSNHRERPTTFIDRAPKAPLHTDPCPTCQAEKVRAVAKGKDTEYQCGAGHVWLLKGKA